MVSSRPALIALCSVAAGLLRLPTKTHCFHIAPAGIVKNTASLVRHTSTSAITQSSAPAIAAASSSSPWSPSSLLQLQHGGRSRSHWLRMGWGGEVEWKKGKVLQIEDASPNGTLRRLSVQVGDDIAKSFTTAGQFVQIKTGSEKPGYFAIASSPKESAEGVFSFIIKKTESNGWLTDISSGASIDISAPTGSGFKVSEELNGFKYDFPCQNVLLVATGTGIAPIASLIDEGALEVDATNPLAGRSCKLYYGIRSAEFMPVAGKIKEWEDRGIEVVTVMSQPPAGYTGRKGYVQDALKEDGVRVPRNTGVVLCGQKEMVEAIKGTCVAANVFEGRLLTNF